MTDGVNLLYHFRYQPLLNERGYDPYLMTSIEDGDGTSLLRNEFADRSRVSAQRLADGQIIRYDYLYNRRNEIVETRVTLPNGATQRFLFKEGRPAK